MKKSFFALAALAVAFVSCNGDGADDNTVKPLDASLTFAESSVELVYGEPATIAGTIQTTAKLDQAILTGVKAQGESYVAVGEAQSAALTGLELAVEFFADTKDMTAIEVKLVAGKQEKAFYLPAKVTGELKGTVWTNDAVTFQAAPMVAT